ncbi:MAG: hypothetical protein NT062_02355 [Proteobacteria bacterium]|nr:hypothetical protein [Pseudomonadota bacterium]
MKLVGERRAIAAAVFGFFAFVWILNALNVPEPLQPVAYAMFGVYALAFFAVVAGYFWARWYAMGVGLFGVIVSAALCYQLGALEPMFLFLGGTHLGATVLLWGDAMSEPFEGQRAWRDRYHMDDNAVQRLGRSVIRAGISLPFVLIYGLAPKPEGGLAATIALGLAVVGFGGLLKMRTWGVLAIATSGVVLVGSGQHLAATGVLPAIPALVIGAGLLLAAAPFARPIGRWIHAR